MAPKNQPFHRMFRKDKGAVSPAISSVIMTSAIVVMVLVAMSYGQTYLNNSLAQNEFNSNKKFMQTTSLQLDDVAWTTGRTQTISYSSRFSQLAFNESRYSLHYTAEVFAQASGWHVALSYTTGIIMFNTPIDQYSISSGYYERVFPKNNASFVQESSTAPVGHVFVTENLDLPGAGFIRVVVAPSIREIHSGAGNNFFLPKLVDGTNRYLSQSVTLEGRNVSQYIYRDVTQVRFTLTFPQGLSGFDSTFFGFDATTQTVPVGPSGLVIFYLGEVAVSLGAF
jgi:hypothetical protein